MSGPTPGLRNNRRLQVLYRGHLQGVLRDPALAVLREDLTLFPRTLFTATDFIEHPAAAAAEAFSLEKEIASSLSRVLASIPLKSPLKSFNSSLDSSLGTIFILSCIWPNYGEQCAHLFQLCLFPFIVINCSHCCISIYCNKLGWLWLT